MNKVEVEIVKAPQSQRVLGGRLDLLQYVRLQSTRPGARVIVDLRAPSRGWCSTAVFSCDQLPPSNRRHCELTLEVIPFCSVSIMFPKGRKRTLTEILALHETILDGTRDALARLLLVSVVGSTVEQAVSLLDRVVYSLIPESVRVRRVSRDWPNQTYVGASLLGDLHEKLSAIC